MVLPGDIARGPGRERFAGLRQPRLVPERDAVEVVGPLDVPAVHGVVLVALVLHGDLQRFGERDRVQHVPAIADAAVAGLPALPSGLPEPGAGPRAESPGIVEIVLAPSSLKA